MSLLQIVILWWVWWVWHLQWVCCTILIRALSVLIDPITVPTCTKISLTLWLTWKDWGYFENVLGCIKILTWSLHQPVNSVIKTSLTLQLTGKDWGYFDMVLGGINSNNTITLPTCKLSHEDKFNSTANRKGLLILGSCFKWFKLTWSLYQTCKLSHKNKFNSIADRNH